VCRSAKMYRSVGSVHFVCLRPEGRASYPLPNMARRDSLGAGSLSPVRALKARGERPAILGAQGSRSPLGGLRSPCNAARRSLVERANPADATLAKSVNVRPGGFSRKQVSFESDRHSRINAFFNEGDGLKDPGAPGGCNPAFHVRQRRRPPTPNGVSVRKHDLYGNNDGWFSPQNRMRALPHLPPSPVRAPHSTPVQGTGVPPSCVNASSSEDASDNEFHPDRQSPLYVSLPAIPLHCPFRTSRPRPSVCQRCL
jgi:hypothetical protein